MTPAEVWRRAEELVRQAAAVLDRLADKLANEAESTERSGATQKESSKQRGH